MPLLGSDIGKPARRLPLPAKIKIPNPRCDVRVIEPAGSNPENPRNVLHLTLRLSKLRPLELGHNEILGGGYIQAQSRQFDRLTSLELLAAEGA